MRNRIYRWLIVFAGTIGIVILLYHICPVPQNAYTTLLISGAMVWILSVLASLIAPKLDLDDRFSYDELEDYEPNLWCIRGGLGTRLIKSKSNPYVVYIFFYFAFVPIFPIGCRGYTFETDQYTQEPEICWCGAKWNILDIAIIYWRWVGYLLIGFIYFLNLES